MWNLKHICVYVSDDTASVPRNTYGARKSICVTDGQKYIYLQKYFSDKIRRVYEAISPSDNKAQKALL